MARKPYRRIAAIEAGGTKFALAVGDAGGAIFARQLVSTRDPHSTLTEVGRWFASQGSIDALGIATFGPADIDQSSSGWGRILGTPKAGWAQCDLAGFFADAFKIPIGFDTDVNGAALGEFALGAGRGRRSLAYVTVGTGVGGGLVIEGRPVHGAGHPEMGHLFPRRSSQDRTFRGTCPFHGDCLEGLASGPAILKRWGAPLSDLPDNHEAHAHVAGYLAELCHSLFAVTSVEVIVLGGGVMKTPGLLEAVRERAQALDRGYFPGIQRSICAPRLGDDSGLTGALLLGSVALDSSGGVHRIQTRGAVSGNGA